MLHTLKKVLQLTQNAKRLHGRPLSLHKINSACVCVSVVYTKVTQYGNESEHTLHFIRLMGGSRRGGTSDVTVAIPLFLSLSLDSPAFLFFFFSLSFPSPLSTLYPSSSPLRICDLYSRSICLREREGERERRVRGVLPVITL